ncbi:hypothetical protein DPMN_066572 [Dreissena polymorpha]|uniref:Uncharacterized protein n=1 Tax=Dreissena polymorpha TaxID=45954 RepID=A0A9D3YTR6_DREPO|nr:hypothetical protein DPMN_066572 [Dreissena polymorpha]
MNLVQLVDIESAPVTELQMVPGISARVAQAIVANREIHGSITPDALADIPYIRLSSQMRGMLRFNKSDYLAVNVVDSENEEEEEEYLDASRPLSEPVDKGMEPIERMKAVIANASLSGPHASYVNPPDAREDEQGARPKSSPPKVDARWQQVSVEQPVQYRAVPVTSAAVSPEAQPAQYHGAYAGTQLGAVWSIQGSGSDGSGKWDVPSKLPSHGAGYTAGTVPVNDPDASLARGSLETYVGGRSGSIN